MNILKSLRAFWVGDEAVKGKSVDVKNVSIEKIKMVDSIRSFTYEDSDIFEKKLDEILSVFEQSDSKYRGNLLTFLYDIINRDSQVYSNFDGKSKFKYSCFCDNDTSNHHFEVFYGDQKVMVIDADTTSKGAILKFHATYRADISSYNIDKREVSYYSNLGTVVLKVDCPVGGAIELDSKIYTLDLLSGIEYSDKELNVNIISDCSFPLGDRISRR